ncbi:MAG: hemerythrin domain-containing protein [Rubrivivax sp.]|nr:hemerythrin domain-containing protein [Rubrivivax sp.]
MDTLSPERDTTAAKTTPLPAPQGRVDLYAGVHKALRLAMARTLTSVGSTDPDDAADVATTAAQVGRLLDLCEKHLQVEEAFVHPALERAQPGSAARIAAEHVHHAETIADLRDLAGLAADSQGTPRAAALGRLYRALALFVADNLQHMHVEETAHNTLLWAHYSDEQLLEIEHAILGSIPAPAMAEVLQLMFPALAAPERAALMSLMRPGMPPEAFLGVLEIARATLSPQDHAKLCRALGVAAAPGLMTA